PLPPVRLDMPPLATLPVVAPPLEPGQHPAAYAQLRVEGGVVEQRLPPKVGVEGGEGEGEGGAGAPAPANAGLRAQDPPAQVGNGHGAGGGREQYERTWDRVVTRSGEFWGEILGDPEAKSALPGK